MVRRIEAESGYISKGANPPSIEGGTQGIAAIFDQPEIVLTRKLGNRGNIERISQCVREDHGLGPRTQRFLQLGNIHIVGSQLDIYEDRHQAVLQNGIHCRRKSRCNRNDFIARFELSFPERRGGQRRKRHQVCRRTGIHQPRVTHSHELRKLEFK